MDPDTLIHYVYVARNIAKDEEITLACEYLVFLRHAVWLRMTKDRQVMSANPFPA